MSARPTCAASASPPTDLLTSRTPRPLRHLGRARGISTTEDCASDEYRGTGLRCPRVGGRATRGFCDANRRETEGASQVEKVNSRDAVADRTHSATSMWWASVQRARMPTVGGSTAGGWRWWVARACVVGALGLAFAALTPATSNAAGVLTRNPYLTDMTATSVRVNWATPAGGTASKVTWGSA